MFQTSFGNVYRPSWFLPFRELHWTDSQFWNCKFSWIYKKYLPISLIDLLIIIVCQKKNRQDIYLGVNPVSFDFFKRGRTISVSKKCPRWLVPICISNPSSVFNSGHAITPKSKNTSYLQFLQVFITMIALIMNEW